MPALRASVWWFYKHADPTGLCLVVSVHSTNMPALRTGLCLVVSAHSTNMPALRAYDWWFPCILQTCQPCILQICRPYGPLSGGFRAFYKHADLRASVWWFPCILQIYRPCGPLSGGFRAFCKHADPAGLCLVVSMHSANMSTLRACDWWFPCILQTCRPHERFGFNPFPAMNCRAILSCPDGTGILGRMNPWQ